MPMDSEMCILHRVQGAALPQFEAMHTGADAWHYTSSTPYHAPPPSKKNMTHKNQTIFPNTLNELVRFFVSPSSGPRRVESNRIK